uniref:Uncharacterized protein n=1 Tax=viral metagenome TaxID=1070528 RepID=A0A6M3LTC1_9ZZZZ
MFLLIREVNDSKNKVKCFSHDKKLLCELMKRISLSSILWNKLSVFDANNDKKIMEFTKC